MEVLLVSQSQDGSYVSILNEAVKPLGGRLTVISGKCSDIPDDISFVNAPKYNSLSFVNRLKTWLYFIIYTQHYLYRNIPKFDVVVFTSNPPINQGLVRYIIGKNKKSIYVVWDIYPEMVEKTFGRSFSFISKIWRKRNREIYKNCSVVVTIGYEMRRVLGQSYPNTDIQIIPYHTNTDFIHPMDRISNPFVNEHGLENKKIFLYSGKMGAGHGFDEILSVAEKIQYRNDIAFVLIGFGSSFNVIKHRVEGKALGNMLMLSYQPLERLPYILGSADVSFITIKEEMDGLFLPSKVYDAMASASAILCISGKDNDIASLVSQKEVGVHVDVGDEDKLQQTILRFADDAGFLAGCQKRARELALTYYTIEKVTDDYRKLFRSVMETNK